MNTENKKMKLKRATEHRNVEEFTKEELDEIQNIKEQDVNNTDTFHCTNQNLNKIENENKEEEAQV
jgi:hypothetical protein